MEAKDKALNLTRKWWLSKAIATLPLLASALLLSCVDGQEEVATSNGGGEATVRLHISVGPIGDLNATRATDTNATEGELINSLCVFIVDSDGKIEAKIQPDLTGTDADNGNLEDYTSDQITLTTGEKTIYAFANWENAEVTDNKWETLIAKEEGGTIKDEDLQFLVINPASCVDIGSGKYIPMSGITKNVKVVDLNVQSISVELIRLVGKVEVNVSAVEQDLTVTSLAFDGTAGEVWLFNKDSGLQGSDDIPGLTESPTITLSNTTVNADNTETIATFYVNESTKSYIEYQSGFKVTLNTQPYKGFNGSSFYTSTITNILRNNIYILNLTLDRYVITLNATALTSILAVDGQKKYYQGAIQTTEGDYVLSLYDVTSEFILTATMTDTQAQNKDITSEVTWTWEYENDDVDKESINNADLKTNKLTATQLTATPDYKYAYTLKAEWNDGVQHARTYSVKVDLSKTGNPFSTQSDAPAKQSGEATTPVIMKKRETFK